MPLRAGWGNCSCARQSAAGRAEGATKGATDHARRRAARAHRLAAIAVAHRRAQPAHTPACHTPAPQCPAPKCARATAGGSGLGCGRAWPPGPARSRAGTQTRRRRRHSPDPRPSTRHLPLRRRPPRPIPSPRTAASTHRVTSPAARPAEERQRRRLRSHRGVYSALTPAGASVAGLRQARSGTGGWARRLLDAAQARGPGARSPPCATRTSCLASPLLGAGVRLYTAARLRPSSA